jgi:hypothetical protein
MIIPPAENPVKTIRFRETAPAWFAWADAEASRESVMAVAASSLISVLSIR